MKMDKDCKVSNPLDSDAQLKQCFDTLPAFVKENIKQTGVEMCTVDELKKCADNLTKYE